jgi:hypothetical protein
MDTSYFTEFNPRFSYNNGHSRRLSEYEFFPQSVIAGVLAADTHFKVGTLFGCFRIEAAAAGGVVHSAGGIKHVAS